MVMLEVLKLDLPFALGVGLALVHFSVPLVYYWYAKTMWMRKPWDIAFDAGYRPKVTVVIPTYNEAGLIEGRLENVFSQGYPLELLEVLIVDSSSDGTAERALEWARVRGFDVKVLREPFRRGKARALNDALRVARGEIIVFTDADSLWAPGALATAVGALADPNVGAVSCIKTPLGENGLEEAYRGYYNVLRVAESRAHATPVFHGELAAFKKSILEKLGGFPEDMGADDSHTAAKTALEGYRAIILDTIKCKERVPQGTQYHLWRLRRAQHLIQSFTKLAKHIARAPKEFKLIIAAETYLHIANPWLLPTATLLLTASALKGNTIALLTLALGLLLLALKAYRAWVQMQVYLVLASVRNLWGRELVWAKIEK